MKLIFVWILIIAIVNSQISMKNIQDGKKYNITVKKGQSNHLMFEGDFRSNNDIQFQFQNNYLNQFMNKMNVYLSQKNQLPNESRFGHKCEDVHYYQNCEYKYDIKNVMHESGDRKKQKLFMTIECIDSDDCQFQLRVIHSTQLVLPLTSNTPEVFQVRSYKDEFNLYLPLPINDTNYQYFIIKIDVIQVNHKKMIDGFNPIIKTNDRYNITQFSDDHKMLAVVDRNENNICEYCYFPFTIQLPSGSLFQLNYQKRNYNGTQLRMYDSITDNIKSHIFKTYIIKDLNISKSYVLTLKNINGNRKTLYANPAVQPNQRSKYEWITGLSRDTIQDNIIIMNTDLQRVVEQTDQNKVDIHVGVYSQNYGFFTISIYETSNNNQISLDVGSVESGSIINQQIINYKLSIWKNQSKDQKQKVKMMIIIESGMIDIAINQCKTYDSCQSVSESNFKKNIVKKTSLQELLGYQTYIFEANCDDSNEIYCYYMIGLKGKSILTHKSFYNLRVYYENGFQILHEAEPQQIHIVGDIPTKLKYTYSGSLNILDKLKFIVSNNNVDLIVKTGTHCYSHLTVDHNDKDCQQFRGDSLLPIEINRGLITSNTFYVIVYSQITTNALIEVQVYKNRVQNQQLHHDQQTNNVVYLHQGISYNSQLTQQEQVKYFKFRIDYMKDQEIFVNINGVSKNYIVRGKQGTELVDRMNYDWISNDNLLIINYQSNPTAYKSNGQYTVMVESVHNIKDQSVQFSIQYYVPSQTMNIHLNQPLYNRIDSKKESNYQFYVDHDINDNLYIMTHIMHNSRTEFNLNDHLQISVNNQPKPNNQDILKRQWHQQQESVDGYDWQELVLEPNYSRQLCQEQKNYHHIDQCRLYIQVFNPNDMQLQYMFQIQYSRNKVQIQEGRQAIIDSQTIYQHKLVQILLVPEKIDQNIDIQLQSYSNYFSVELTIQNKYSQQYSRMQQSYHNNRHLFVVHSDDLIHCKPNCIIKIQIFFNQQDQLQNQNSQFRIYVDASGQVTQIQDSKQYTFSVQKKQIRYFRYDFINQESNLQTQINSLHGRFVVYYKLCLENELVFPTEEDFDNIQYASKYQLEKEDLQKMLIKKYDKIGNRQNGMKNMFMMIGVGLSPYGNYYNEGLFEMKITHKYTRYYSMFTNHYQQFHTSKNNYTVFKIYNSGEQQTQLKMIRTNGYKYSIKYNFCDYSQNNIQNQFTNCVNDIKQQDDFQLLACDQDQALLDMKNINKCQRCLIVILVYAIDKELTGMMILKKKEQPENLNQETSYKQQLKQKNIQGYQILQYGRFNIIHLKVTLITGKLYIYRQNNSTFNGLDQDYFILDKNNNILDTSIPRDTNKEKIDGFYRYLDYFGYKYIYVKAITDCAFTISYSYDRNEVQELNDGELTTSYFVKEQMGTKNFRFECKRNSNKQSCYVSVFQNYRNDQDNIYNIDYLTVKFSYENYIKDALSRFVNHNSTINKQYLKGDQIQTISSGDNFITYKLPYNIVEDIENPSNIFTLDIKMNQTVVDGKQFIFDVVKQQNRNLVIPQNGELTLTDDNKQTNDIQIYIEDDGYLMLDIQQCIGDIYVELEIRKEHDDNGLLYLLYPKLYQNIDNNMMMIRVKPNQLQYIKVMDGLVTIKITSLDSLVIAKIKTRFFTDEEYKQEEIFQISDTNDFNIQNINNDSQVRIQFSIEPVQCTNCKDLNTNAYVDYKFIISDKLDSIYEAGVCGLCEHQYLKKYNYMEKEIKNISILDKRALQQQVQQQQSIYEFNSEHKISSVFELQNTGVIYYVQTIAMIKNTTNGNDRVLVYPIKELVNPIWYHTRKGLFRISLAIISIIMLLFIIYVIRSRNTLLQKKIRYEMSDIRNIASIKGDQTFEMSQMVQIKGIDIYEPQKL